MMGTDTPRYWKPLKKITHDDFDPLRPELIADTMKHYGIDEPAARALIEKEHFRTQYWVNEIYQVAVTPVGAGLLHMNIRRRDGGMVRDWRHFQQIKNEVAGEEREAFELYPAESRKVDTANKWHLYVLPEGQRMPVGWSEREVNYDENKGVPGMRQRAL